MPHVTLEALAEGPVFTVKIELTAQAVHALHAEGKQAPQAQLALALLDTGAGITLIDPALWNALGEPRTDWQEFRPLGSEGPVRHPAGELRFTFLPPAGSQQPELEIASHRVASYDVISRYDRSEAQDPEVLKIAVLLGWDFLSQSLFSYDPHTGAFVLGR